jgi:hypothetical protein
MSRRARTRKRERKKRQYAVRPETGRAQDNLAIPQTSADARGEKLAMNLSKNHFWFSDGFDESAKSFINDNPWPEASNHCYFESLRWSDLLRKNGFNAEIVMGWYGSCFHAWVTVNGKIFDATCSQFEETPSSINYRTEHAVSCWEDLVALAFSLAPAFLYFPESTGATVRFSLPALAQST